MIDHLLRETAKALVKWSSKAVGNIRLRIQIAMEVIFRLEVAQDSRSLSPKEISLRRFLKLRYLGLTSLQRTIAWQQSSLRWLREGDANTKLFHLHANHRRRKNFTPSLLVGGRSVFREEDMCRSLTTACSSTHVGVEVVKVEGRCSSCGIHKCRLNICSIDRLQRWTIDQGKPMPPTAPAVPLQVVDDDVLEVVDVLLIPAMK
jgi:hypothetical protein